jgi:hypothetical protein
VNGPAAWTARRCPGTGRGGRPQHSSLSTCASRRRRARAVARRARSRRSTCPARAASSLCGARRVMKVMIVWGAVCVAATLISTHANVPGVAALLASCSSPALSMGGAVGVATLTLTRPAPPTRTSRQSAWLPLSPAQARGEDGPHYPLAALTDSNGHALTFGNSHATLHTQCLTHSHTPTLAHAPHAQCTLCVMMS